MSMFPSLLTMASLCRWSVINLSTNALQRHFLRQYSMSFGKQNMNDLYTLYSIQPCFSFSSRSNCHFTWPFLGIPLVENTLVVGSSAYDTVILEKAALLFS